MKTSHPVEEQYSVAEAAERLGLCPDSVYDLVKTHQIRSRRKGPNKGRIFFFEEDLTDYLDGRPNRTNRKK